MNPCFDIAIVGGGILGCATALRLRQSGMRPIVLEAGDLGQGASGVNAGTLSLQIKRVKLMPYALRGHALWEAMGEAVGFRKTGGVTVAFTEAEAALLEERMRLKKEAGAPVNLIDPKTLTGLEPRLSHKIIAASYCAQDGHANSSLCGQYYRRALQQADIPYRENTAVTAMQAGDGGFTLHSASGVWRGTRLLLACGAWLKPVARQLGVDLPVRARVNTVSVTERAAALVSGVVGHASGLLTLKQKANGTVLIGGGWQGRGAPCDGRNVCDSRDACGGCGEVVADTLTSNLQLAQYALPALAKLRVLRAWTGFEAHAPDFYPLAGALPTVANAYLLGCVRGGYTIGPYIGKLMGDFILGRTTELPLFDPQRSFNEE